MGKAANVDTVIVYCVNDGAVMKAWAKEQNVEGTMVRFLADPTSEVTNAFGLVLDHDGVMGVLGNKRCQRFSMLIDNGNVKSLNVSASAEDPAGDADPSASLAEKMVEDVQKIAFTADTN